MATKRTKGSIAQRELARALIAEGVPPLEAFERAGYRYPKREISRQTYLVAEAIAEVTGATPIATLDAIARYGADPHAASACAAILDLVDAGATDGEQTAITVCPTTVLPVDAVPTHGASHLTYADEVPAGETIHESLDAVLEQLESAPTRTASKSPQSYARARLTAMLADPKVADGVKITASKALIKHETPAPKAAVNTQRVIAVWYLNQRGPLPPNTNHVFVMAPADQYVRVPVDVVKAYRGSLRKEAA